MAHVGSQGGNLIRLEALRDLMDQLTDVDLLTTYAEMMVFPVKMPEITREQAGCLITLVFHYLYERALAVEEDRMFKYFHCPRCNHRLWKLEPGAREVMNIIKSSVRGKYDESQD